MDPLDPCWANVCVCVCVCVCVWGLELEKCLYRKRTFFDTNFLGPSEENAGYVESTWTKLMPF